MKLHLYASAAAFLMLGSTARADVYSDLILSDNPVAYYRFDDATDSSGNGFNGTIGGTGSTFPSNYFMTAGGVSLGSAFSNTADSFIDLGLAEPGSLLDDLDGASQISVEFWIDVGAVNDPGNILFLPTPSNSAFVGVNISGSGNVGFGGRSQASDGFQNSATSAGAGIAHIAGVYDYANDEITIYVNGVANTTSENFGSSTFVTAYNANPGMPSGGNSNPRSISIGRGANGNAGATSDLLIDELAIYDFALSASDIEARINLTAIPEPSAAVGFAMIGVLGVMRRRRR